MTDDEIAALERAAIKREFEARVCSTELGRQHLLKDAATIRAIIERERAGGERAKVVAWLKQPGVLFNMTRRQQHGIADAIASGAHLAGEG